MVDSTKLYPDFTLTPDNCHEEPIHRPVAIQGHGHMLLLSDSSSLNVHAVSSELAALLQCDEQTIWTMPIEQWLPESLLSVVKSKISESNKTLFAYAEESTPWSSPSTTDFDVIIHGNGGCIVLEWEPAVTTRFEDGILANAARRMANSNKHEELFASTTELVARAFQFDRVMIYQFDKDNHGCVVGESKQAHLEPYIGLHYPETDIPKIARELFLKIKSRFISDINVVNTTLVFNPALGPQPPHLDLTYSQLRATSPIHIEYLANMGVTGTMSISIVLNGKLWGLIACHHYSPKGLAFSHRVLSETIGDLLAKRILEIDIEQNAKQEKEWREVENKFLEQVRHGENYRIDILENASLLMDMCDCSGAALVTLDDCPYSNGMVPDKETLMNFRQWLIKHDHTNIFETSTSQNVFPLNGANEPSIGGVLAVCISSVSQSFIFWFRPLTSKTTNWAGDPENSFSVTKQDNSEEIRISPRQSFEKWKVTIDGQSNIWDENTLEMARRLRDDIFRKELVYSAMLAKRTNEEFMQLTFAAAHDLQEPLRTQANYLELIEETLNPASDEEISKYLKETMHSGMRMKDLITDLLTYSSLTSTTERETISLDELLAEILRDLSSAIQTSGATITSDPLPYVLADHNKMKQLLQNLISNAIKYVDENTTPVVHVFMQEEGSYRMLCVKDNGIGIQLSDHEKIFKMFQRLHRKTEYEGTGIGLATCKKVAESMDATIDIESNPGGGSVFIVKFHHSMLAK